MAGQLIFAGTRLTAALLNSIAPLGAIKGADQLVTSSTTLQNDNALLLPVAAGVSYLVDFYVDYEGGATGSSDLKMQWSVPSGATMRYGADFASPAGLAAITGFTYQANAAITAGTNGANLMSVRGKGSLLVSATAGTLQMRWAQVTSSGTPTIVHAQSYVALWRMP